MPFALSATTTAGLLFGLGAAFFHACSYVASRRFFSACGKDTTLLFGFSHLHMGVFSVVLFPLLLPGKPLPPIGGWWYFMLGTAGFYMTGQWLMLHTLRHTDSSKVAPLLGLKIPVVAMISAVFLGDPPTAWGWVAVFLCTAAALSISPPTGMPELRVLGLVILTCGGYCMSDIFIPLFVRSFDSVSSFPAPFAVCLVYIVCGVVGVGTSWRSGKIRDRRVHLYAFPHAVSWILAMVCLFACFALIGVVPGNMLQSTRGIMSVVMGLWLTRAGLMHLDDVSGKGVFIRRLGGACAMAGAIVLFLTTRKPEEESGAGTIDNVPSQALHHPAPGDTGGLPVSKVLPVAAQELPDPVAVPIPHGVAPDLERDGERSRVD